MKNANEKNFERELPTIYRQAFRINAKDTKVGIIFNSIALVVLILVMAIAALPLYFNGELTWDIINQADSAELLVGYAVFLVTMIAYIVLHELVHGAAYKAMTGEKLTFGMSWSCAFCGVPHIYTYRKTALIAVIAPFAVFTLIFIPLTVVMYFISPLYYLLSAFIFGLHLGGCSGDLYVTILFITKFRDARVLMRDTGPEQTFYVPEDKEND